MAEVVTFIGYRPPARFDNLPWTEARIEESDAENGTFVLLETITLDPVDTDPEHPAARSFTTQLGTAIDYWYRVVFADADGDTSQPTTPVQNMSGGTVTTVTAYASVDELARILHIRNPTVQQQTAMQRVLDSAALEIDSELGLTAPYSDPPALAVEVNLERAVEHWQQQESPFGIIGLGETAGVAYTARDSFDRHAHKLAPLKTSWGIS